MNVSTRRFFQRIYWPIVDVRKIINICKFIKLLYASLNVKPLSGLTRSQT